MPFLAVIAAGVVARGLSSGFENWYGLRLIAGLGFLYAYRVQLRQEAWRFGLSGALAGVIGFVIWLAAAHWLLRASNMPAELLALDRAHRYEWLTLRVLGAVVVVPIVEELAFRGYLLRRLESIEFESVRYRDVRWPAIFVSSAIFGVVHGVMWLPGVLVGLLYSVLVRKTGRIGDAILAHLVTNALLATCVLWSGQWQLW
jgi:CAAX prenyl protease-like protein